jgi:general secretion pathway protein F
MPLYRYKAIAATGGTVNGCIEAASEALLAEQLRARGQYPVSATLADAQPRFEQLAALLRLRATPSPRALTIATQELAALLSAGLTLDRALGALVGLSDIGSLQAPLAQVRQRVRDGASFAAALEREDVFPAFYVNMVRAGETGGTLEHTLSRLADYLSRSAAIRDAVASALVYPSILLATAFGSIGVILFFVLPEFWPLFADAGHALPWSARVLMDISDELHGYWWLILSSLVLGIAGVRRALQSPPVRIWRDRQLLALPVLGETLKAMEIERFCRTLGTLVANGVALPAAVTLSAEVLWNKVLHDAVAGAARGLREGERLSQRLAATEAFPGLTLDLIRIGEETGKLDAMLLKQADLDEHRVRHAVDRLLAMLVPVLTILLGFLVAGMIATMLVAILSVNDLAQQ